MILSVAKNYNLTPKVSQCDIKHMMLQIKPKNDSYEGLNILLHYIISSFTARSTGHSAILAIIIMLSQPSQLLLFFISRASLWQMWWEFESLACKDEKIDRKSCDHNNVAISWYHSHSYDK